MKHLALGFLVIFCVFVPTYSQAVTEDVPTYVSLQSIEGMQRFDQSKFKTDFFFLVNHFEPQQLTPWGGVATAVVVMNTLRAQSSERKSDRPVDKSLLSVSEASVLEKEYNPFFSRYTQNNIFMKGTKTKTEVLGKIQKTEKGEVRDRGYQLRQLQELFLAHKFKSEIFIANSDWTSEKIIGEFKKNLVDPKNAIVINYRRSEMGQPQKNGHFSPLGAYDEKSDSFLVLDVNSNLSTWGWVRTKDLLKAMQTRDTLENRGYLVISE